VAGLIGGTNSALAGETSANITAFAEPKSDGSIGTGLGAFSSYLPAVVSEGHSLDKSVVVSIGGAFPASLATQFATIVANPALRQTFSNNVVDFVDEHDLDGVDIDSSFLMIASATPAMSPARLMVLHGTPTTSPGKLEAVWRDTTSLGPRGFARLEVRMKP
jgi:hypothetical protein